MRSLRSLALALALTALASAPPVARAVTVSAEPSDVWLSPPVDAGEVGWCVSYALEGSSGWSCPVLATQGRPVFAEQWSGSAPPPVSIVVVLTTSEVASVSVLGSAPIPTVPLPTLPDGFRAVSASVPEDLRTLRPFRFPVVPLGESGSPVPQLGHPVIPQAYELPVAASASGEVPTSAACSISHAHVPHFGFRGIEYVRRLQTLTGLLGRPYLACATAFYLRGHWPLRAAVVLDAASPGAAPAALPGARAVPGRTGVVQEPGNLRIVGRRVHGGWLLVEGGESLAERLTLLRALGGHVRVQSVAGG